MFDMTSYVIGHKKGKTEGQKEVTITGGIACADDGQGNITITEE